MEENLSNVNRKSTGVRKKQKIIKDNGAKLPTNKSDKSKTKKDKKSEEIVETPKKKIELEAIISSEKNMSVQIKRRSLSRSQAEECEEGKKTNELQKKLNRRGENVEKGTPKVAKNKKPVEGAVGEKIKGHKNNGEVTEDEGNKKKMTQKKKNTNRKTVTVEGHRNITSGTTETRDEKKSKKSEKSAVKRTTRKQLNAEKVKDESNITSVCEEAETKKIIHNDKAGKTSIPKKNERSKSDQKNKLEKRISEKSKTTKTMRNMSDTNQRQILEGSEKNKNLITSQQQGKEIKIPRLNEPKSREKKNCDCTEENRRNLLRVSPNSENKIKQMKLQRDVTKEKVQKWINKNNHYDSPEHHDESIINTAMMNIRVKHEESNISQKNYPNIDPEWRKLNKANVTKFNEAVVRIKKENLEESLNSSPLGKTSFREGQEGDDVNFLEGKKYIVNAKSKHYIAKKEMCPIIGNDTMVDLSLNFQNIKNEPMEVKFENENNTGEHLFKSECNFVSKKEMYVKQESSCQDAEDISGKGKTLTNTDTNERSSVQYERRKNERSERRETERKKRRTKKLAKAMVTFSSKFVTTLNKLTKNIVDDEDKSTEESSDFSESDIPSTSSGSSSNCSSTCTCSYCLTNSTCSCYECQGSNWSQEYTLNSSNATDYTSSSSSSISLTSSDSE